jgi:bacteriocin biosynthesis cyclodehydratase domain-containing protein
MAAAVRVSGTPCAATDPAVVIGGGPFGQRVAGLLHAALPASVRADVDDLDTVFATGAGPVVVALWRASPTLCERADELSFRYRRIWLPIVHEYPVLHVGPLVYPPSGPCFGCYRARRRQHSDEHRVAAALEAAYEADAGFGPTGHLPHHARLAAGAALGLLRWAGDAAPPDTVHPAAGQVVAIALTGSSMTSSRVVACHDCPRRDCAGTAPLDLATIARGLNRRVTAQAQVAGARK